MADIPIDTNVIVRYLTETVEDSDCRYKGVFRFFEKLETGSLKVFLPDLVLFQAYFVLTSFYNVPRAEAAEKLRRIVNFTGVDMLEKEIVTACLKRLEEQNLDLVDCYLLSWSENNGSGGVYSYDKDLEKNGLNLFPIK